MKKSKPKDRVPTQTKKSSQCHSSELLRIRFLWTKTQSSRYRRLSGNVAREICMYLEELSELLHYSNSSLYLFNPVKRTKELLFRLDIGIRCVYSAVLMGRQVLMVVCTHADELNYLFFHGSLRSVPGCRQDRLQCALLYDSTNACVYIFGGRIPTAQFAFEVQSSRVCEKLPCASLRAEQLPEMLEPRYGCAVCWHQGYAYLCGGSTRTVERFAPRTYTFTKVGDLGKEITFVVVFSYRGYLYLFDRRKLWKGNGRHWEQLPKRLKVEVDYEYSVAHEVSIVGNCCYFLGYSHCVVFNMCTLTETSYSLRSD